MGVPCGEGAFSLQKHLTKFALDQLCPFSRRPRNGEVISPSWGALRIRLLHAKYWRIYPSVTRRKLKDRLLSVFDPDELLL